VPPSTMRPVGCHRPLIVGAPDYEGTAKLLQFHGVVLDNVARKYPYALRYDFAKMAAAIRTLNRHSIDIGKAINRCPQVLSIPPEVLDARFQSLNKLLSEWTLQHDIKNSLSLLSLTTSTLESKMAMLTSLGLDARRMVKRCPRILASSKVSVRSHMTFFEEIGLDVVRILNAAPEVVCLSIERTLRPLVGYITKDMGRSLVEIYTGPRCFSTSLEHRLKPRHEYLMLHGKRKDYSLGVICSSTDERFILLTDQSLDHYRLWLAARNR